MKSLRSIIAWAFALSIAAALAQANVFTVTAVIFLAWAFLIVEVEFHVRETQRQHMADMLSGMDAASKPRMGKQ